MNGAGFFWNGVVAMSSPWVAAAYSFHPQPDTLYDPPFLDGFNSILGAGWMVSAIRAQQRRQGQLINADGKDEKFLKHFVSVKPKRS